MRLIHCDAFDGNHAARAAQPEAQLVLGQRTDLPDGPPLAVGHGKQCRACHLAQLAAEATAEDAARLLRAQALNKLRTFGGAPGATTLTAVELRRIFEARDRGDT